MKVGKTTPSNTPILHKLRTEESLQSDCVFIPSLESGYRRIVRHYTEKKMSRKRCKRVQVERARTKKKREKLLSCGGKECRQNANV